MTSGTSSGSATPLRVLADDAELWAEVSGSGLPVLLSHGGPGLCDNLVGLARILGPGYRVVRYDQRGCYRSGRGRAPLTISTMLEDMEHIRSSAGVQRWIVGGHSWGANLSLLYTLRYPERVLALLYISGGGVDLDRSGSDLGLRRSRLTSQEWLTLEHDLACPPDPSDADYERRMLEIARLFWLSDFSSRNAAPDFTNEPLFAVPRDPEIFATVMRDFKSLARGDLHAAMRRCRVPALVLRGEDDPIGERVVAEVARLLPYSSYVQLPGVGHVPWLERPQLLRVELSKFLAGRLQCGADHGFKTPAAVREEMP